MCRKSLTSCFVKEPSCCPTWYVSWPVLFCRGPFVCPTWYVSWPVLFWRSLPAALPDMCHDLYYSGGAFLLPYLICVMACIILEEPSCCPTWYVSWPVLFWRSLPAALPDMCHDLYFCVLEPSCCPTWYVSWPVFSVGAFLLPYLICVMACIILEEPSCCPTWYVSWPVLFWRSLPAALPDMCHGLYFL